MTYKTLKKMLMQMSKDELKQEVLVCDPNDEVAPVLDMTRGKDPDGPVDKGQFVLKSGVIK